MPKNNRKAEESTSSAYTSSQKLIEREDASRGVISKACLICETETSEGDDETMELKDLKTRHVIEAEGFQAGTQGVEPNAQLKRNRLRLYRFEGARGTGND